MNHELFRHNPFLKSPEIIPEGVYLAKGVKDPNYSNSRKHAEPFGIYDSLVIITKRGDKLIGFSVGLKSDLYQNSLIIKEIPLIRNYCDFFLNEASKTIEELEYEPINIIPYTGNSFNKPQLHLELSPDRKRALLARMRTPTPPLSSREKECLRYYLEGETASSIANLLALSTRTVEQYLENCKIKLDAYSKTDLIKVSKILQDSGFLAP